MVKISIPDQQKDLDKKPILKTAQPLKTNCEMENLEMPGELESSIQKDQINNTVVIAKAQRKKYKCTLSILMVVVLLMIFQLKSFCDLKQENLRLKKALRLERIKDATLKRAVSDYVPEADFLSTRYSETDIEPFNHQEDEVVESGSRWSINVGVLWTSDDITRCDMALLSKYHQFIIYLFYFIYFVFRQGFGSPDLPHD